MARDRIDSLEWRCESIPVLMLPLAIAMILIHLWLVQQTPSDRPMAQS
ncbi:MAG: hypothetical protein SNJ57_15570 [Cyanobacteriota bacterium]